MTRINAKNTPNRQRRLDAVVDHMMDDIACGLAPEMALFDASQALGACDGQYANAEFDVRQEYGHRTGRY